MSEARGFPPPNTGMSGERMDTPWPIAGRLWGYWAMIMPFSDQSMPNTSFYVS